jgi:hypothetical protein
MTPGMPQLTPQQIQQFMQMMQMRQGGAGGGQQPQQTQPRPMQAQTGAMPNPGVASAPITPVTTQPQPIAPSQPQQYGGSRGANLLNTVMQIKQATRKSSVDKFAKLFAWGEKVGDPKEQQRIAEESKSDPARAKLNAKMAKELVRATSKANDDPYSAEAEGLQQMKVAKQQQEQQEQQRQIAQQQFQMNEALKRAQAAEVSRKAETMGEVTPHDKFIQDQQNKRAAATVKARSDDQANRIQAMQKSSKDRLEMMEKIAKMKEVGLSGRAGQRQQQSQAAQAMYREATGIQNELNELERRRKDIADNIEKHPVEDWLSGAGDQAQADIAALDQKIQQVQTKQQVIYTSFDAMQASGVIPRVPATPTVTSGGAVVHDFTK